MPSIVCLPVMEKPESLMSPDAHQSFHRECLEWPQSLTDTTYPASHLTGTVDVMWLGVLGELVLKSSCIHF